MSDIRAPLSQYQTEVLKEKIDDITAIHIEYSQYRLDCLKKIAECKSKLNSHTFNQISHQLMGNLNIMKEEVDGLVKKKNEMEELYKNKNDPDGKYDSYVQSIDEIMKNIRGNMEANDGPKRKLEEFENKLRQLEETKLKLERLKQQKQEHEALLKSEEVNTQPIKENQTSATQNIPESSSQHQTISYSLQEVEDRVNTALREFESIKNKINRYKQYTKPISDEVRNNESIDELDAISKYYLSNNDVVKALKDMQKQLLGMRENEEHFNQSSNKINEALGWLAIANTQQNRLIVKLESFEEKYSDAIIKEIQAEMTKNISNYDKWHEELNQRIEELNKKYNINPDKNEYATELSKPRDELAQMKAKIDELKEIEKNLIDHSAFDSIHELNSKDFEKIKSLSRFIDDMKDEINYDLSKFQQTSEEEIQVRSELQKSIEDAQKKCDEINKKITKALDNKDIKQMPEKRRKRFEALNERLKSVSDDVYMIAQVDPTKNAINIINSASRMLHEHNDAINKIDRDLLQLQRTLPNVRAIKVGRPLPIQQTETQQHENEVSPVDKSKNEMNIRENTHETNITPSHAEKENADIPLSSEQVSAWLGDVANKVASYFNAETENASQLSQDAQHKLDEAAAGTATSATIAEKFQSTIDDIKRLIGAHDESLRNNTDESIAIISQMMENERQIIEENISNNAADEGSLHKPVVENKAVESQPHTQDTTNLIEQETITTSDAINASQLETRTLQDQSNATQMTETSQTETDTWSVISKGWSEIGAKIEMTSNEISEEFINGLKTLTNYLQGKESNNKPTAESPENQTNEQPATSELPTHFANDDFDSAVRNLEKIKNNIINVISSACDVASNKMQECINDLTAVENHTLSQIGALGASDLRNENAQPVLEDYSKMDPNLLLAKMRNVKDEFDSIKTYIDNRIKAYTKSGMVENYQDEFNELSKLQEKMNVSSQYFVELQKLVDLNQSSGTEVYATTFPAAEGIMNIIKSEIKTITEQLEAMEDKLPMRDLRIAECVKQVDEAHNKYVETMNQIGTFIENHIVDDQDKQRLLSLKEEYDQKFSFLTHDLNETREATDENKEIKFRQFIENANLLVKEVNDLIEQNNPLHNLEQKYRAEQASQNREQQTSVLSVINLIKEYKNNIDTDDHANPNKHHTNLYTKRAEVALRKLNETGKRNEKDNINEALDILRGYRDMNYKELRSYTLKSAISSIFQSTSTYKNNLNLVIDKINEIKNKKGPDMNKDDSEGLKKQH